MRQALRTVHGYRPRQLAARATSRASGQLPWGLGLPLSAPPLDPAAVARIGRAALAEPGPSDGLAALDDPWGPRAGGTALDAFALHYHSWLVPLLAAGGAERAQAWRLLEAWLRESPPTRSALRLRWHPYVVSTRVRAWSAALAAEPPPALQAPLELALWQGLALLAARPERDVAGNHELRNATALAAGAALFAGDEARRLQEEGERRAARLAADQLRPDGGHVERSTGYGAQVAGDLLDLVEARGRRDPVESVAAAVEAALGWLAHVAPPGLPRPELNDSNPAIGAPTATLLARAAALGLRPVHRPLPPDAPGYVVLGDEDTRLLLDADQPTRPDLPYHAHADSLAIWLAVDGVPLVVDRAVGTYEPGPERAWWRSTAAHSTVEPAGGDTSELVGAFRAARLARTRILAASATTVAAEHDGAGQPGRGHARRVRQDGPAAWTVWDAPAAPAGAVARFHLPPGAAAELAGDGAVLAHDGVRLRLRLAGGREPRLVETPHALGFGRVVAAPTLEVPLAGDVLETRLEAEG